MQYLDEVVWGPITPKWAGTYEMELHDIVALIALSGYSRIINIGCAEGYYAVGLLFVDRNVEVFAIDRDPFARRQVARLARLNHVSDRLRVISHCTPQSLNRLIASRTLVLCDIEGDEKILIDPTVAPNLKTADLLIEIHDQPCQETVKGVEFLIAGRLRDSHRIERRVSLDREMWIRENRSVWEGRVSRARMMKSLGEGRSGSQVYLWAHSKRSEPI